MTPMIQLLPRAAVVAVACLLAGCAPHHASVTPRGQDAVPLTTDPAEARDIARDGFIYGLPLVMNYAVNYEFWVDPKSSQYKGPFNELSNEHRVFTYQDTAVVTPNSDTPYSFAGLDLRAEPFVISVPAVERSRYYSVQLVDWNTFNYGYIGSRATGDAAGDYLIAGPDWHGRVPHGIRKVYRSTTDFTIALFRTQLFGPSDMPNVLRVQEGYRVRPLSAFLGQPAPAAAVPLQWPPINQQLAKTGFFEYVHFLMALAPAGPEEVAIRKRLARIGVGTSGPLRIQELSPAVREAVAQGMAEGEKAVDAKVATVGSKINGWSIASVFGDRKYYHGDWLLRAAAAKAGIYGNDAVEAMYPMCREDSTGAPLDGSKHRYTLTFPAGQLPPVNAFWSVTMYDGRTQLLIENPINRYLVNSPMLPGLKRGADGSVTLYIQKDSPGAALESNWLPAPDGPIYLVMRLYWPRKESPSILPPGKGEWKPPGIAKVQ